MKKITTYILIIVLFNISTLILFRLPIFSSIIFFYRGIIVAGITVCISFVLVFFFFKKYPLNIEAIIAVVLLSATLNLAFFAIVPVTLDRSISIFLLNNLEQQHVQTKKEMVDTFISEYVYSQDAVGRRIFEQVSSGNITVEEDKIKLSKRGENFLVFARFMSYLYGI